MSAEKPKVLGLGTVVVDHQVFVNRLPEPDTKGEVVHDRLQVGGPVATALVLLSRLGLETEFVGRWSLDEFGDRIEQDLERWQVGTGLAAVRPEGRSGFAHVWVEKETGRRSIAAYRGSHRVEAEDLEGIRFDEYQALHLDGWSTDAAIRAAQQMRAAGGEVFLDLGSPKPRLDELLSLVDCVNCPRRLLTTLYSNASVEEAGKRMLDLGIRQLTVTDGEDGAWLVNPGGTIHQPAFEIDAVDTNGAGDVFVGALIYAVLAKFSDSSLLSFASAAAALKCGRIGNREALPTIAEINELRERAESDQAG